LLKRYIYNIFKYLREIKIEGLLGRMRIMINKQTRKTSPKQRMKNFLSISLTQRKKNIRNRIISRNRES
jgi:hypothetical protein